MVLPIPHKIQPKTWRVEQGVLSSFLRTSKNANIPLQLNFTTLDDAEEYIEIEKVDLCDFYFIFPFFWGWGCFFLFWGGVLLVVTFSSFHLRF